MDRDVTEVRMSGGLGGQDVNGRKGRHLGENAGVQVDRDVTEVRTLLTLIGQEYLRVENARWTRWTGRYRVDRDVICR